MILRILFLLLISFSVEAADKYIDTSCTFNGDGTAAACAASGGAAGAYNTGASWTNGAGNNTYFKRGTTVSNLATIISSANQTFDDYGTADACPIITNSGTFVLSVSANDVTFNDICVTGAASSALISTAAARTILNRVKVYSNSISNGIGVRFNNSSSDGQLNDVVVTDMTDDGIGISASATGLFTITNLNCSRIDTANSSGDCIQAYDGTPASLTVSGGTFIRETGTKQAIRYSGSGSLIIKNRPKIYLLAAGAQAVSMDGTGSLIISSIQAEGTSGAPLLYIHNTGQSYVYDCELKGNDYGIWSSRPSGNLTIRGCNIYNSAIAGVYNTIDVTGGTTEVYSSFIRAPKSLNNANTGAILKADYNTFAIPVFAWNGATINTLATWRSTSSQDTNSQSKSGPEIIRTAR